MYYTVEASMMATSQAHKQHEVLCSSY